MSDSIQNQNRVIKEYHQGMTKKIGDALSHMLDEADDVLFKLSTSTIPGIFSDQSEYFLALREIRLNRETVEAEFKNRLEYRLSGLEAENTDEQSSTEDLDIEEKVALANSIRRANLKCRDALFALDQKMHSVLENTSPDEHQSVINPEDICSIFSQVSSGLNTNLEIKLVLLKLFEKYVALHLDETYTVISENIQLASTTKNVSADSKTTQQIKDKENTQTATSNPEKNNLDYSEKNKTYYIKATSDIRREIYDHINDQNVPEFIRIFLLENWSKLMMKIYMRDGSGSRAWLHAVDVIDDLVSCLNNPEQQENGKALFNLKQRLIYGMNVIPVSPHQRDSFINELTSYIQNSKSALNEFTIEKNKDSNENVMHSGEDSEDVTTPNFLKTKNQPFMSELLVDHKK